MVESKYSGCNSSKSLTLRHMSWTTSTVLMPALMLASRTYQYSVDRVMTDHCKTSAVSTHPLLERCGLCMHGWWLMP